MDSTSTLVSPGAPTTISRSHRTTLAAVLLVFVLFASGGAFTRRPDGDEVFSVNSALNLARNGKTGMTVMEPTGLGNKPGTNLIRLNERNYHIMPLSFVGQALWYKTLGFSIPLIRFYSVFWAIVLLLSLHYSVKALTGNPVIALLTAFLLGTDYMFVQGSTDGRPDMMSAALGLVALAAYLRLRTRSLGSAILAAVSFLTLAVFTHPLGAMASVPLFLTYVLLDGKRFSWTHVPLAAAPFLIGAGAYGLYILQDPIAFQAQFGVNASGRLVGLADPVRAFRREIGDRFLESVYLPHYASGVALLRIFIILTYWSAIVWIAFSRRLRSNPRYRLILLIIAVQFFVFTLFEGNKNAYYLVHIFPYYATALAICLYTAWRSGTAGRAAAVAVLSVFSLLQMSWMAMSISKNPYRNSYLRAVQYLQQNAGTTSTIFASGELGFALGFGDNLRDDSTLGFYTGKKADYIVIDENMYRQSLQAYSKKLPALDVYVKRLLSDDYHRVYNDSYYEIYRRNSRL